MSNNTHNQEIEIKLRVPDVTALRRRLICLRARKISRRTYETNTLYDTPKMYLRRRGRLIRIRIERPSSSVGKKRTSEMGEAVLTYKGPSHLPRSAVKNQGHSKDRGRFKIKDETETRVSQAEQMARILRALGLHPVFRYEKFRTTYVLPGVRGLNVELDETPIGIYLELEGPPAGIDRAASLLGYSRKDYLKETYGSLYLAECRRRGLRPGDMLFSPIKKLR
jgi:adenylate cyclase class 2